MAPQFPTLAAATAALLGLLAVLLAVQVIRNRVRFGVNQGDGGHAALAQAIRAHANLAEHAPLVLLLLALAESSGGQRGLIAGLAGALLVARLASAWGLSHTLGPSTARQAGAGLTLLVMVLTAMWVLFRVAQVL